MQKTGNNQRRDFLKKIPLAIVSIGAFSLFKLKKQNRYSEKKFKTISKSEADRVIKNEKFSIPTKIKPEQVPVGDRNIKG
jgi:hypothetical protein